MVPGSECNSPSPSISSVPFTARMAARAAAGSRLVRSSCPSFVNPAATVSTAESAPSDAISMTVLLFVATAPVMAARPRTHRFRSTFMGAAIVAALPPASRSTTVPLSDTPHALATEPPVRSSTPPSMTSTPLSAASTTLENARVVCCPLTPPSPRTSFPTVTAAVAALTVYVPDNVISAVSFGPGTLPVLQFVPSLQLPPAALIHETFPPVPAATTRATTLVAL